ncbi:MAG: hypothetical protein BJ554DRAFT_8249, partial [Olpidium bornovanus]
MTANLPVKLWDKMWRTANTGSGAEGDPPPVRTFQTNLREGYEPKPDLTAKLAPPPSPAAAAAIAARPPPRKRRAPSAAQAPRALRRASAARHRRATAARPPPRNRRAAAAAAPAQPPRALRRASAARRHRRHRRGLAYMHATDKSKVRKRKGAAAARPGGQLVPSLFDKTFKRNTRSRSKQQLSEQQAAIVTEQLSRASPSESTASALPISFGTTTDAPINTPAAFLAPQGAPFPGRFPTGETPSATRDQRDTQSVFAPRQGRPRKQLVNDDDAVDVSLSHNHQRSLFGRTPQYERGQYENEAAMARKVGSEYEGNDRFDGARGGGGSLDMSPSALPTDPHRFVNARNQGNVVENRGTAPRPDTMQDFVRQCLPHTPRYASGFEPYPNGAPYPQQGIPGTYYAMPQWYAMMPGVTPAPLDPNSDGLSATVSGTPLSLGRSWCST